MADQRARINKDLERSQTAGSMISTDTNRECYFLAPGANETVLHISGGVPTWSDTITLLDLTITGWNNGNTDRVVSSDANGRIIIGSNQVNYINSYSVSGTPSAVVGPATGAGGSVTITGNNEAGVIQVSTGPVVNGTGLVATVTFNGMVYPQGCSIVLFPMNASAANMQMGVVVAAGTQSAWSIASTVLLAAGSTFQWNYIVRGF